jgi:hypothetical protein
MGKKSRLKKLRREMSTGAAPNMWASEDGIHTVGVGQPPSPAQLEAMTKAYQERIRNSPLWDEMVKKFGEERANQALKEFIVKSECGT